MALPKRKHSKARGRKRRTHWKLSEANLTACPQCKEPKLPHAVCPACGTYKGRLVVDLETKKKKKAEKKKKKSR